MCLCISEQNSDSSWFAFWLQEGDPWVNKSFMPCFPKHKQEKQRDTLTTLHILWVCRNYLPERFHLAKTCHLSKKLKEKIYMGKREKADTVYSPWDIITTQRKWSSSFHPSRERECLLLFACREKFLTCLSHQKSHSWNFHSPELSKKPQTSANEGPWNRADFRRDSESSLWTFPCVVQRLHLCSVPVCHHEMPALLLWPLLWLEMTSAEHWQGSSSDIYNTSPLIAWDICK